QGAVRVGRTPAVVSVKPEEAPALAAAADDGRAADQEEAGGGEQDADEVPGARHQERAAAAVDGPQGEQVDGERQEAGRKDQRTALGAGTRGAWANEAARGPSPRTGRRVVRPAGRHCKAGSGEGQSAGGALTVHRDGCGPPEP